MAETELAAQYVPQGRAVLMAVARSATGGSYDAPRRDAGSSHRAALTR